WPLATQPTVAWYRDRNEGRQDPTDSFSASRRLRPSASGRGRFDWPVLSVQIAHTVPSVPMPRPPSRTCPPGRTCPTGQRRARTYTCANMDWSNPKTWFSNQVYELLRPLFGQSSAVLRRFLSDSWVSWRLTLVESGRVGFGEATPVEVLRAQSTSRP